MPYKKDKLCPVCKNKYIQRKSKACNSCTTKAQWADKSSRDKKIKAIKRAQPPKERNKCVDCGETVKTLGALRCANCNRAHVARTRKKRAVYSKSRNHKISKSLKDKYKDPKFKKRWMESLRNNPIYNRGPEHPTWKNGGKRYQPERERADYFEWRKAVFERDNYTCQKCGKRGGKLNAHHIWPFLPYPDLRTDVDNGVTLCARCHRLIHSLP